MELIKLTTTIQSKIIVEASWARRPSRDHPPLASARPSNRRWVRPMLRFSAGCRATSCYPAPSRNHARYHHRGAPADQVWPGSCRSDAAPAGTPRPPGQCRDPQRRPDHPGIPYLKVGDVVRLCARRQLWLPLAAITPGKRFVLVGTMNDAHRTGRAIRTILPWRAILAEIRHSSLMRRRQRLPGRSFGCGWIGTPGRSTR
jgi:hypothetical protein